MIIKGIQKKPKQKERNKHKENKKKYREFKNELVLLYKQSTLIILEVKSLGFVSKNINDNFATKINIDNIDDHYVINKLTEVAIRCSYMI